MIKDGFILRKMPGMNLVMPTGKNVKNFNGALMLNDTAAFIFEGLKAGKSVDAIVEEITKSYEVEPDKAREDVERTIVSLKEARVAGDA